MKETFTKGAGRRKWYDKYLPFVARSPEMQIEWLTKRLSKLSAQEQCDTGRFRDETSPYIKLFLEGICSASDEFIAGCDAMESVQEMFNNIPDYYLPLLMECTDIYDVPKLFPLIRHPSKELAMAGLKKVPPPYEKQPLLVIDRVFHAIKEAGGEGLLESAAESLLEGDDQPVGFSENYERFKEIMLDEHILSMLYPNVR